MKVKLNILLIEDDFIEVMKLKRAISSLSLNHNLLEAKNGEEALEVLQNTANLPDIILLDLHMPKMNGIEFLEILKADEQLRQVPAIILTTSSNRKDLLECYRTGIAGYVIKPLKYDDYVEKIGAVLKYWTVNELIQN
ncbi:MAG: response regulator [Christiangramia sp.]|nr:response regulator [Christiangramia sp.]|tara:strand:+ start:614 stop:1027 length:414 start_codon:yes stop_codon:yes gene_type:complete